jgi:hypothetical protein
MFPEIDFVDQVHNIIFLWDAFNITVGWRKVKHLNNFILLISPARGRRGQVEHILLSLNPPAGDLLRRRGALCGFPPASTSSGSAAPEPLRRQPYAGDSGGPVRLLRRGLCAAQSSEASGQIVCIFLELAPHSAVSAAIFRTGRGLHATWYICLPCLIPAVLSTLVKLCTGYYKYNLCFLVYMYGVISV